MPHLILTPRQICERAAQIPCDVSLHGTLNSCPEFDEQYGDHVWCLGCEARAALAALVGE